MNTQITYLYRDASNYKEHYACILDGEITLDQVKTILASCDEGTYFIPEQVGLDCNRFGGYTVDDHPYCEISEYSFGLTDQEPSHCLTVNELVEAFAAAAGKWDETVFGSEEEGEDEE